MNYRLFIDECGDHNLGNFEPNFPVFTLCAVLISEASYEQFRVKLNAIKLKYWQTIHIVFHSRDIRKCQNGFENLFDLTVKENFYKEINQLISQTDFIVFSCTIQKEKYIRQYGRLGDVYSQSLSYLFEKLVVAVAQERKLKKTGAISVEIMIEKRGGKEDKLLLGYYNKLLDTGTYFAKPTDLQKIISGLKMTWKRENINGLQLADLLAYPISRYVISPQAPNPAFEVLQPKFYSRKGKAHGFKIFP